MRRPLCYRYFLAFRPDTVLRCWLTSLADAVGQHAKRVPDEYFHLTLCVIAELHHRDPWIVAQVRSALHSPLSSCRFQVGRLQGDPEGAAVHAVGSQCEIQDFYRTLVARLATRAIVPLYRESGLHPHVTLGRDPCVVETSALPREWIPDELLLIESEVGNGVHRVQARWPLLPPRQGSFAFEVPPLLLAAAGLGR